MSLSPVLDSVEAEEQQLQPGPVRGRVHGSDEAARVERLDEHVDVGEAPRDQRERRAGGEQLVGAHVVVGQHVSQQAVRRVEVERGVQCGGPRHQGLGGVDHVDQRQHHRGMPSPMLTQVSPGVLRTENTARTSTTMPRISNATRPARLPSIAG